jgi:biotin carboxylase
MKIVALEWLTFGLGELVDAAEERACTLHLLTRDRSRYSYEIERLGDSSLILHDADTTNADAVIEAISEIGDVGGLVSCTDTHSLVASEVCERLGLPGQNPQAVRMVRNKTEMRNRLHAKGLSRAPAISMERAVETHTELSFPLVIKDSAGTGSKNVWLARSPAELQDAIRQAQHSRLRGFLSAEPYFIGPLYSVETITWEGQTRVLGVTGRVVSPEPYFREEALNSPVAVPRELQRRLDAWISEVLDVVGYDTGVAHTEFIVTKEGFEVVEINPRLIGGPLGTGMCKSYGTNLYTAFLDMARGKRPEIMDRELTPQCGTAHLLLYAPSPGIYRAIEGAEVLAIHPGEPEIRPVRSPGDAIVTVENQDGMVAFLSCTGETSEIALQNALSAATKLRVKVDPAND